MSTTKERVIELLIKKKNCYISGEEISELLGITRASVWKHINSLKKEGFEIESRSGLGYKLTGKNSPDISPYEIKHGLNTEYIAREIKFFDTIGSTNAYAREIAEKCAEGTVVISREQTSGRGRTGRNWISGKGDGIYFSIILKPQIPVIKASFLTQVAGASIVKTLDDMGIKSSIKWPNDIIINNRKIAGILTEMSAEIDKISYIVIGIGINLDKTEFEPEIENSATSLLKEGFKVDPAEFLRLFFSEFEIMLDRFIKGDVGEILDILRNRSAVLGRDIYILESGKKTAVYAQDIDRDGNLIVKYPDGSVRSVFSGEISIRGIDSYI